MGLRRFNHRQAFPKSNQKYVSEILGLSVCKAEYFNLDEYIVEI